MGFDDLARHMKARDGGKLSGYTDPNLMMVEASERAQSSERTSNLVLGPLLVVGGLGMIALLALTSVKSQTGYARWGLWWWAASGAAVIAGVTKIWRGLLGRAATE